MLNLINLSQNRNDANELEIINDTIENLKKYKNYFLDIYANVGCVFPNYLQNASDNLIQKLQDDIRLNLFLNTDLKNEQYPNKILKILDSFLKKLVDFLRLMNQQLFQRVMYQYLSIQMMPFHLLNYMKSLIWKIVED